MSPESHERLLARSGRFLARRAYSRGELGLRLARAADAVEVEAVLDRLEALGLLNDANYAYDFGLHRLTREGWGPLRIRRELIERGVAADVVEAALARLSAEMGEDEALAAYLRRWSAKHGWPVDRRGGRRIVAHLERRGFSGEAIHRGLRRVLDVRTWRQIDSGD
jgi:regulatory protein